MYSLIWHIFTCFLAFAFQLSDIFILLFPGLLQFFVISLVLSFVYGIFLSLFLRFFEILNLFSFIFLAARYIYICTNSLAAAPHETPTVRPPAPYHEIYSS